MRVIAIAKTRDDVQVFLGSQAAGFHHLAHAGRIDGNWLLAEDMLAGFDRVVEMDRAIVRARAKQHDIDAAVNHALIRVETMELTFLGKIEAVLHLRIDRVRLDRLFELVLEQIAAGDELGVGISLERVFDRAIAAPAEADETDAKCVGTSRMRHAGIAQRQCRDPGHCRGAKKLPAEWTEQNDEARTSSHPRRIDLEGVGWAGRTFIMQAYKINARVFCGIFSPTCKRGASRAWTDPGMRSGTA